MITQDKALFSLERQLESLEADKRLLEIELDFVDESIDDLGLALAFVEEHPPVIAAPSDVIFRDDFNAWAVEPKYYRRDDPRFKGSNNFDMYDNFDNTGPWNQYFVGAKLIEGGPRHAVIECTDQGPVGSTGPNTMRFWVDQRDVDTVEAVIEAQGSRANSGIKVKIMKDDRGGEPRFEFNDGDVVSLRWRAFYPAATNLWLSTEEGRRGRAYRMPDIGNRLPSGANCDLRVSNAGPRNAISLNWRNFDMGFRHEYHFWDYDNDQERWPEAHVPTDEWFTAELRFRVGQLPDGDRNVYPLDKDSEQSWFELRLNDVVVLAGNATTRGKDGPINAMGFGLNNGGVAAEVFYDWIEVAKLV